MNTTQLESSVHADVDIDLANHEQEKQGPPTISQLDDVLPESYERTYIPDGELQVPVRIAPKPRNQRRPFPTAIAVVAPAGNQHFPAPVARRRTVSAPTRGAAKAANAGRTIKRKASLAALSPKRGIKQSPDGEHPPLSGRTAHNTRSKALLTKDVEASISSAPPLTIRIPARKGVEKQRDIPDNVKENPSVVEVSSAKQTNKRTQNMLTRSSDKMEVTKIEATEVPASGRLKRKELHENKKGANPKGTGKRAKKNHEIPVEDRPKITLRIPKRPTPIVDEETVARAEREEIRYAVNEPKPRRGSRQRVPIWRICPE
ncbi:hypothetical protein EYR40_009106 [Pleurotus pulmonarius]|nr:hypothetical protein EYR40_009106 [Pleurotus pulmonarius]